MFHRSHMSYFSQDTLELLSDLVLWKFLELFTVAFVANRYSLDLNIHVSVLEINFIMFVLRLPRPELRDRHRRLSRTFVSERSNLHRRAQLVHLRVSADIHRDTLRD